MEILFLKNTHYFPKQNMLCLPFFIKPFYKHFCMEFRQLSHLIWKLMASLGVQEGEIIFFLLFYCGEQIDDVGYPKVQAEKWQTQVPNL